MAENTRIWEEKFWSRELPVLSRTVDELTNLRARADRLSAQEIASVILHDPMMTLNILQLANSRHSSRFGAEITTVEHAVLMLGVTPFFAHFSKLEKLEKEFAKEETFLRGALQVISRSYHAACYAWDWAVLRKDIKAEEVYIAALLADMGELLLCLLSPYTAMKLVQRSHMAGNAQEAEEKVLGCTLHELTMAMAKAWHLPELLVSLIDRENNTNPRTMVASLSVMLAQHSAHGWDNDMLLADYEALASLMHMPLDEVVAETHQTAVNIARHWDRFNVRPAAAWLPLLPGEWPAPEQRAPITDSTRTVEAPPAQGCLAPQRGKFEQAMREVSSHLDGTLDLHDMMALVLKGMHEGIGLNRVVFALFSADRAWLKAKYVIGAEQNSPLRRLAIAMDGTHMFARLMDKMQGVWYRESNRATLDPLIPDTLRQQIGKGEFFAMSIFVHGKAVGLFYADRQHGTCQLDERSYDEFKQLCVRAVEGLGHLARK